MRKLLLILAVTLLLLGGCSSKVELKPFDINSTEVDMSGYTNMSSVGHNFKAITPSEMLRIINEGGSAIVYMGYAACTNCQKAVGIIDKAAKESNVTVYYMDCYGAQEPLGEKVNEVIETLKPILRKDSDDEYGIFTPHVFTILNGEFGASMIGLDYDNEEDNIKAYKKMFEPFAPEVKEAE